MLRSGDTRLKWLAGYFYSDFQSGWDIIFPSQTGAEVFGSNNLFSYYSPFKILQQSVFGEVTYNITEPFAVTVGARRYHYDAPVEHQPVRRAHEHGQYHHLGGRSGRHPQGDALLPVRQGPARLCDGGEGLPPGRRHRPGADLGTALLRGAANGPVRLQGVRRGTDFVQFGQRMELRAR